MRAASDTLPLDGVLWQRSCSEDSFPAEQTEILWSIPMAIQDSIMYIYVARTAFRIFLRLRSLSTRSSGPGSPAFW